MYSEKVQPHRAASKAVDSCFLNAAHELSSWMKIYSMCFLKLQSADLLGPP